MPSMKPPPPILTFCQVYGCVAVAADAAGAAVTAAVMATIGTEVAATVASVVRTTLRGFLRIGGFPLSAADRGESTAVARDRGPGHASGLRAPTASGNAWPRAVEA